MNWKKSEPLPDELLQNLKVTGKDFQDALKLVTPSAMREVLVEQLTEEGKAVKKAKGL